MPWKKISMAFLVGVKCYISFFVKIHRWMMIEPYVPAVLK